MNETRGSDMASIVGSRGQITLEKELRDELGIQPGWRVVQRRVDDRVELVFFPPRHRRSLLGALADPSGPSFPDEASLREAIDRAWELELRERYGSPEADK
jgi:bifunctional DNA-binding transcriptional regulator/antitoxin component of YhaV-PrlF toxin-antitoxin module